MKVYGLEIKNSKWIKNYRLISWSFVILGVVLGLFVVFIGRLMYSEIASGAYIATGLCGFVFGLIFKKIWFLSLYLRKTPEGKAQREEGLRRLEEEKKQKKNERRNLFRSTGYGQAFWFGLGFGAGDIFSDGHDDGAV